MAKKPTSPPPRPADPGKLHGTQPKLPLPTPQPLREDRGGAKTLPPTPPPKPPKKS